MSHPPQEQRGDESTPTHAPALRDLDDIGAGSAARTGGAPSASRERAGRLEIAEAFLVAVAALLTAWAAFQSTKWGGVQADSFNRAGAARTESVRASNLANRQTVIDVTSFTSWVNAVASERRAGIENGLQDDGSYAAVAGTQSAFLHDRFRPEFTLAFDAWIAQRPLSDPDAASTPFELGEYRNAAAEEAAQLEQDADAAGATGRQANQRGDNYVMMTIVFALALVLVSVGAKMQSIRIRTAMAIASGCAIALGAIVLFSFPVEL